MNDFPGFMKSSANRIKADQQNTDDIEGYYFEGSDGSQMAFWTCYSDKASKEHVFIPRGTAQSGRGIIPI